MKTKNIIQFMPYFPPHIWGVEKVWEDIFLKWTYWKSIVFSWEIENNRYVYNENKNINIDNKIYIWYSTYNIVDNFPIPLIWTKRYKNAIKELTHLLEKYPKEEFYVITHTRFFFSSFLWGRFAKKYKLKWTHIEHWSDYVKLSSKFKCKIAYIYDRTLGKYIFKKADRVLAISQAAQKFVRNKFWKEDVDVWYRNTNTQLVIVWDWEDFNRLKKINSSKKVYFIWWVDALTAYNFQSQFDIHVHPSSPWGWLATTLLQAMNLWCFIVATPYEWANEVIVDWINGI